MFNLGLKFQSVRLVDGHTYVYVYPAESDPNVAMLALFALREQCQINQIACSAMMMRIVGEYKGEFDNEIVSAIEGESGDYGLVTDGE